LKPDGWQRPLPVAALTPPSSEAVDCAYCEGSAPMSSPWLGATKLASITHFAEVRGVAGWLEGFGSVS